MEVFLRITDIRPICSRWEDYHGRETGMTHESSEQRKQMQVPEFKTEEEAREFILENGFELSDEQLDQVVGGIGLPNLESLIAELMQMIAPENATLSRR